MSKVSSAPARGKNSSKLSPAGRVFPEMTPELLAEWEREAARVLDWREPEIPARSRDILIEHDRLRTRLHSNRIIYALRSCAERREVAQKLALHGYTLRGDLEAAGADALRPLAGRVLRERDAPLVFLVTAFLGYELRKVAGLDADRFSEWVSSHPQSASLSKFASMIDGELWRENPDPSWTWDADGAVIHKPARDMETAFRESSSPVAVAARREREAAALRLFAPSAVNLADAFWTIGAGYLAARKEQANVPAGSPLPVMDPTMRAIYNILSDGALTGAELAGELYDLGVLESPEEKTVQRAIGRLQPLVKNKKGLGYYRTDQADPTPNPIRDKRRRNSAKPILRPKGN